MSTPFRQPPRRLFLEPLEDRQLLSVAAALPMTRAAEQGEYAHRSAMATGGHARQGSAHAALKAQAAGTQARGDATASALAQESAPQSIYSDTRLPSTDPAAQAAYQYPDKVAGAGPDGPTGPVAVPDPAGPPAPDQAPPAAVAAEVRGSGPAVSAAPGGNARPPDEPEGIVTPVRVLVEPAAVLELPEAPVSVPAGQGEPAAWAVPLGDLMAHVPPQLAALRRQVDSFFARLDHLGEDLAGPSAARLAPWLVAAAAGTAGLELFRRQARRRPLWAPGGRWA
jgi:hypothetical protein